MARMENPGALAGATGASGKPAQAAGLGQSVARNGARVIFESAAGPEIRIMRGRELWALRALLAAGSRGVSPRERPALRWSAYVHRLRDAGLVIETIRERHGPPFEGWHGRYVLRSPVAIEGGAHG